MLTYDLLADSRTSNQADHKRGPYGGAPAEIATLITPTVNSPPLQPRPKKRRAHA